MSAAYRKGVTELLRQAQVSFDQVHLIALANEALDAVGPDEMREPPRVVRAAMGTDRKALNGMFWGMRRDAVDWSAE